MRRGDGVYRRTSVRSYHTAGRHSGVPPLDSSRSSRSAESRCVGLESGWRARIEAGGLMGFDCSQRRLRIRSIGAPRCNACIQSQMEEIRCAARSCLVLRNGDTIEVETTGALVLPSVIHTRGAAWPQPPVSCEVGGACPGAQLRAGAYAAHTSELVGGVFFRFVTIGCRGGITEQGRASAEMYSCVAGPRGGPLQENSAAGPGGLLVLASGTSPLFPADAVTRSCMVAAVP